MKAPLPVDRRDTFAVKPKARTTEAPDLVITLRAPPRPAARWVPRRRVILSNGQVKP